MKKLLTVAILLMLVGNIRAKVDEQLPQPTVTNSFKEFIDYFVDKIKKEFVQNPPEYAQYPDIRFIDDNLKIMNKHADELYNKLRLLGGWRTELWPANFANGKELFSPWMAGGWNAVILNNRYEAENKVITFWMLVRQLVTSHNLTLKEKTDIEIEILKYPYGQASLETGWLPYLLP